MSVSAPEGTSTATKPSKGLFAFALLLFLVSGATGLVYEVAWTRRLLLLLGSTATASSIVLATYLGGLGLGAMLGGRIADRSSRPLFLYGVFELLGAAWAIFVPFWLAGLEGAYVGAASSVAPAVRAFLRVVLAVAVVLPGAVAVGATFPPLLRAFSPSDDDVGPAAVLLYGINTLGAVAGALWAGFTGIFTLGVLGSTRIAAAAAAAVGVLALLAGTRGRRSPIATKDAAPMGRVARAPLFVAAFTGLVALGIEAAGVRILVFFVEGFTPSFAAMVATFLAGLALGSLLIGPLLARRRRPEVAVGVLLGLTGLLVLGGLLLLRELEPFLRPWRDRAYAASAPLVAQRHVALLGSALLFLPPALALGAAFPLTVKWASRGQAGRVGRISGRVYLWNSVGAVLGPVLVLGLARLGASGDRPGGPLFAWALLGLLALATGTAIVVLLLVPRRRLAWAAAVLGLVAGFGVPAALSAATPAALVRAGRVLRGPDGRPDESRRLLEVRADETVTASVVESSPFDRILYTDEFAAAATGRDYAYMRMLGHLPVLSAATPENVLVIAFGTGTTAGAVSTHPEVRRLEIAETSRAVLDLAPRFEATNRGVLGDPRVALRIEDGRNVLLHHAADLDVITLEPLMPYTPAALPFYTREFYELARDRLRDGGVLCQWIPVHAMPVDLYASLVRTFFEVFPEGSFWYFEQSSVLIGRRGAKRPTPSAHASRVDEAREGLTAAGMRGPGGLPLAWVASGHRVRDVLDDPTRSTQEAIRTSTPGPLAREVVTDERPFPEAWPAPRAGLRTSYLSDTLLWISGLVDAKDDPAGAPGFAALAPDALAKLRAATAQALLARAMEAQADFRAGEAASAAADAQAFAVAGDARAAGARRVAAERSSQAQELREAAAKSYEALVRGPARDDGHVQRRMVRLERGLIIDASRERFAREQAARAAGDLSSAGTARGEALLLAERAWQMDPSDPVGTERPAAAAYYGGALLRVGRCVEATDLLFDARRLWPWSKEVASMAAFASRRSSGAAPRETPDDLGQATLPPCVDAGISWAREHLLAYRTALREGKASSMRLAADLLLAARGDKTASDAELAAAIRDAGDASSPAVEAERAALLRILSNEDAGLSEMLSAKDAKRYEPALQAAAHYGLARTRVIDLVRSAFSSSDDLARRKALILRVPSDPSPEVLRLLAERLDDADPEVRAGAWRLVSPRLPPALRDSAGYDADGDPQARKAAVAKILEGLDRP